MIFIRSAILLFTLVFCFSGLAVAVMPPGSGCVQGDFTYYVVAKSRRGNGSVSLPFAKINQALLAAQKEKACAVQVNVAPGVYQENLNITRETTISGSRGGSAILAGTITNTTGQYLAISSFNVRHAKKWGIIQFGGELHLRSVSITFGIGKGFFRSMPFALKIAGGAQAELMSVTINDNIGPALIIHGEQTRVWANSLGIERNKLFSKAWDMAEHNQQSYLAALEVSDGARLFAENIVISGNGFWGLRVHRLAQAHLNTVEFSDTTAIAGVGNDDAEGGDNISMGSGGVLEVENFETFGAASCGAKINNSYLTLRAGKIHDNTIGVADLGSEYEVGYDPFDCISGSDVAWYNNGTTYDSNFLPITDPACLGSNPPEYCSNSNCRSVPWESWY